MLKNWKYIFNVSFFISLILFSNTAFPQTTKDTAGIVIKAGIGNAEIVIGESAKQARHLKKGNKLYSSLLDLLEVASRQKFDSVFLYALENENFIAGRPRDNFALIIKGSYELNLIFEQLQKINPPFLKIIDENGSRFIHFLPSASADDLGEAVDTGGPLLVQYLLNFFVTELVDLQKEVKYSCAFIDNKNFVFGPQKFTKRIVAEKIMGFQIIEPGISDTEEYFVYFKNAGKIIDNFMSFFYVPGMADCFKNMEKITLFRNAAGSLNVRLCFKTKNDSCEAAALISSTKNKYVENLIKKISQAQVNSTSSDEIALPLKDISEKLLVGDGTSGEVVLELKNAHGFKDQIDKLCAMGALTVFSCLNIMGAGVSAEGENCINNMKTIDGAVELYSMKNNQALPETVAELYKKKYIMYEKICPSGGTYTINAIGESRASVTCSKHGELKK